MTTKEKLRQMLIDRGMFDNQADQVLEEALPKIENIVSNYKITWDRPAEEYWDRPAEEYPDVVYHVMWIILHEVALNWINKNVPQAWFRSLFE